MIGKIAVALLGVAGSLALPAEAQLGEAQFGVVGSYATGGAYQGGGGLTAGYAPGRLAYLGLRWIYYAGSTELEASATETWEVTNKAQLFGADLGLQVPIGAVEIVVGMTLGAMRFTQEAQPAEPSFEDPVEEVSTSFLFAPLLMAEFRTGPLLLIPQVSYYFAGSQDFTWPAGSDGLALSLMVVVPLETHRITY